MNKHLMMVYYKHKNPNPKYLSFPKILFIKFIYTQHRHRRTGIEKKMTRLFPVKH